MFYGLRKNNSRTTAVRLRLCDYGCATTAVRLRLRDYGCATTAVRPRLCGHEGFTLLELLLAVSILAAVTGVTYLAFSTTATAWKKGITMADNLHHGDFAIDQLAMALRSAYHPNAGQRTVDPKYGFWLEDSGSGEEAADIISWVKLGTSLVGSDKKISGNPHRVKFSIEENDDGESAATVRAWNLYGQPENFDPKELDPIFLSTRISGFDCRVAYETLEDADEIDWLEELEESNTIPSLVEVTFYLEPLAENEDPIEIKRVVRIPVVPFTIK